MDSFGSSSMSAVCALIALVLAVAFGGWLLGALWSLDKPDGIVPDDEQETYRD